MKRRILIVVALLTALIAIFLMRHQRTATSSSETIIATESKPSSDTQANKANGSDRPSPLVVPFEAARRLAAEQNFFKKMNGPVAFYARVIDQHGTPIQNATLTLTLSSYDEGMFVNDKDRVHNTKLQILSDAQGLFELKRDKASSVAAETLEKDGYTWTYPLGLGSFDFAPMNRQKQPPDYKDSSRRFIFHMWKKSATEPVIQFVKRIPVEEKDSEFMINLLSSERGPENTLTPDLRIKLRYISPNDPAHQYDRQMILEAPGGGLVETRDAYLFFAPDTTYQRDFQYVLKPTDLTSGGWKQKYYLKSRAGKIYAGLEVRFTLFPHRIEINAIVNPNGSRNLEPDPEKLITDAEEIRRLDEQTRVK